MLIVRGGCLVDEIKAGIIEEAPLHEHARIRLVALGLDDPLGYMILERIIRSTSNSSIDLYSIIDMMHKDSLLIKTLDLAVRTSCLTRYLWTIEFTSDLGELWSAKCMIHNEDLGYIIVKNKKASQVWYTDKVKQFERLFDPTKL